jgi:hypothetical protein
MRYDLFHAKALHAALIDHLGEDYGVPGERQIRRWVSGDSAVPGWARQAIDELLEQTTKDAPPQWAERLARDTAMAVIGALAPEIEQRAAAALIARLEGIPPPNGGSPPATGDRSDQAGSKRRGRGRG